MSSSERKSGPLAEPARAERLAGAKVTCESAFVLRYARCRYSYRCAMTYVIGSACVDVMDKSCVLECPADCIYEGARSLYINPDECVDCGACKLVCRMEAIEYETDLPDGDQQHLADNAAFFQTVLPGYTAPLGAPGGAHGVGRIGVDTPLVATMPAKDPSDH